MSPRASNGAFGAMAANARAPTCSIHTTSAMNCFSSGRCSSVILSAPGASQSMSASAHCRFLIVSSISLYLNAIGVSFVFVWNDLARDSLNQTERTGIRGRHCPLK